MKTWKKNCNGWDQTKTLKSSVAFFAFKSSFLNQIRNVHCIENESAPALWQNIVKHLNLACGSWLGGGGFQQIAHAIRYTRFNPFGCRAYECHMDIVHDKEEYRLENNQAKIYAVVLINERTTERRGMINSSLFVCRHLLFSQWILSRAHCVSISSAVVSQ